MSMRLTLAAVLCAAMAGPALAAIPLGKDQLTISGRFELPKASAAPLKAGLTVGSLTVSDTAATTLGVKREGLQPVVQQSLEASLRNFGYLAGPDGAATPLTVTLEPMEVISGEDTTTVVARLSFTAPADAPAARCLPATSEARYKALEPLRAGDGQRAAGVLAIVAFAAIGYDATQFATAQFAAARADQQALNARRVTAVGEGVAPTGGVREMTRFAAINATQLAMADFLRQLAEGPCGQPAAAPTEGPPAEPVAETPAAETPAVEVPAAPTLESAPPPEPAVQAADTAPPPEASAAAAP